METKLNQEIRAVLVKFNDKYFVDGIVNKSKVIRDLDSYDVNLVKELLSNDELKKRFTMEIAGATVIKVNDLIGVFEQDEYWQDSYTKYSKKIGLTVNGKFLDETSEVVLDFPYKDTILKASMSKEDTEQDELKPEEPFLNEIIAHDEIDTLLDKKILVNLKRYTKDGVVKADTFNKDNLIIKGNNLIALYTLKEKYSGKVKLIYLDPPYNTGKDSFLYNDRFNHSTWLTFIKNRLEIAKELLSDDGVIFVHLDKNEVHYLAILMDEIFGRKNYVETITVVNNPRGRDYGGIANVNEFILVYKKNEETELNLIEDSAKEFKYKDSIGGFDVLELRNRNSAFHKGNRPNLHYAVYIDPNSEDENGFYPISVEKDEKHTVELLPRKSRNGVELVWRWGKPLLAENANINAVAKKNTDGTYSLMQKYRKNQTMARSLWQGTAYNSFEKGTNHLKKLFDGEKVFSFPKPESTLKTVLEVGSNEGDIVLDFFMGSGTTSSTALKMNRRFIGIEQMDYVDNVTVPRLQKVIEGEQGGISTDVNWQGGGSFVYAELMEKNTGFIKEIVNVKNMTDLQAIFKRMMETADFDFRVDLEELQKENLWQQPIDDQKRILIKVIDKNQLYYNYSEIDDKNVRDLISDNDYEFNKIFYADRGE
ncbi:site-specific DNA-methyltransferase [Enterococcus sp.]|uniref:site-specific DNA-methyltransferase n=1 Tax=Enterococcus sp. TaxID=35783 RepID=UPI0028A289DF|nr:site-specific DNA-methyltransferase [Enterococcus sp.]